MRQAEYQEVPAWKRHKVWCCLRDARDTRCLLHCPWRPPRLFCALQTFRVLSPDSALVTITVFAALNMHSMSQAMPPQLPPPLYPPQYPVPYQPPQYGQQYGQYGQRYGQMYGQQPQYQDEEWEEPGMKAEWDPDRIPPPPPQHYQQHHPPPPPPQPQQLHPPPPPPQDAPVAPSPQDAPVVPEEAGPMDDLPIKQEEVEEPKMDTGEPGHRCVPRVVFVSRVVSGCVPGAIASFPVRRIRSAHCPPACPW